MEDCEYDDPRWQDIKGRLVQDARSDFSAFYRTAKPEDARALDTLVMARHVFTYLSATPREFVDWHIREALERQNHHAAQLFLHLRDMVHESLTFCGLSAADKALLEQTLFEIRSKMDE
jgi:hypothetical protein